MKMFAAAWLAGAELGPCTCPGAAAELTSCMASLPSTKAPYSCRTVNRFLLGAMLCTSGSPAHSNPLDGGAHPAHWKSFKVYLKLPEKLQASSCIVSSLTLL